MKGLYAVSWRSARLFLRVVYGFRVDGEEHVPREGGVLVASNHVSYADPVVAGLGVPRELHFIAKRELFRNRLFAALIRAHNALPVRRGAVERETLKTVRSILESGGGLLIFPEGTRSRDGRIRDARPGVGMIALSAGVPVLPVYVRGTRRMGRSFLRRGHLGVFLGEPVDPAHVEGETKKERYRRIGERVMEEIRSLQAKNG